ncbi:MAG: globin family protein [Cyanobacteria bacterium J06623_7]
MSLQVELLESSFEAVKPQANEFVDSFYENLFTAHPEAKPLFEHTNMASQKKMLLNSLVMVVENLRNPDALDKALRGLGARHVKYGALPEHYPLVGGALLTTFGQYLKEQWTSETKQAWTDAYGAISEIMLDGADYSQADIALKPEPSDLETASAAAPNYAMANGSAIANGNGVTASVGVQESFTHDSGKATMAAFAGGGIMAVITTILILLF